MANTWPKKNPRKRHKEKLFFSACDILHIHRHAQINTENALPRIFGYTTKSVSLTVIDDPHFLGETSKWEVWWYLSAALKMPEAVWDRSSGGQVERKMRSSFIIERIFTADTRARDSSKARLNTTNRENHFLTVSFIHIHISLSFLNKSPGTVSQKCLDLSNSPQWFPCAAALHCGPSGLSSGVTSLICNCKDM